VVAASWLQFRGCTFVLCQGLTPCLYYSYPSCSS
jgi:hypothetical protein